MRYKFLPSFVKRRGRITQSQESIKKLQADVLPEYRRLAATLIEHFIKEFKTQGGDDAKIREHFERMYKWKQ